MPEIRTEQFIRDAAARGWSKTQTRQALGICTYTFWPMLRAMPDLAWIPKGSTFGNKLGNATRSAPTAAQRCALERALLAQQPEGGQGHE